MLTPPIQELPRALPNGLILRRAADAQDLQRVAACHVACFGEHEATSIEWCLCRRPGQSPEDVFLVEDPATGEVVSSINLVCETWTYEGLPIPVGEVGIVSTRPAYRQRGLVRAQFEAYHRLALARGCLLSVIEGIPYFYRQFGYGYALPMHTGLDLDATAVPGPAGEAAPYRLRLATEEDMPVVQGYYAAMVKDLCMASVVPDAIWRYQDTQPEASDDRKLTYLVEYDGRPVGYVRLRGRQNHDWDRGAQILEAYLPERGACLAALRLAKRVALEERQEHTIHLLIPFETPLTRLAASLGAERRRGYAWYVRVLDRVRFLMAIGPALERRLATSPFAGLTCRVALNLYEEALALHFEQGRLVGVTATSQTSGFDLACPPTVMPMIWLGYRSVGEVLDSYPDAYCRRDSRLIIEALFPKRDSWISSLL